MDDGRTVGRRYTISLPCEPNGPGELKPGYKWQNDFSTTRFHFDMK